MKVFLMALVLNILIILNFSSPITLLVSILSQVVSICFLAWTISNSSWPAFILFIIYLGGLMVLFVYIVSLASNEKILNKANITFLLIFLALFLLVLVTKKLNLPDLSFIKNNFSLNFYLMFTTHSFMMILYSMTHLLLSLIVIIKICSKFSGPLKSMA